LLPRPKTKPKAKPIKKIPLITGMIFVAIGILNLVLVFVSSDASAKASYAAMVATFITIGMTLLEKSRVFDR
jgi:flagellar basal body-associated protein FliL